MILILVHLILSIGLLWWHRKHEYVSHPIVPTAIWFMTSLLLIYIDSSVAGRTLTPKVEFARGAIVSLFQVPSIYLAIAWGKARRKSIFGPIIVYVIIAGISLVIAGLFFARTDVVSGLTIR